MQKHPNDSVVLPARSDSARRGRVYWLSLVGIVSLLGSLKVFLGGGETANPETTTPSAPASPLNVVPVSTRSEKTGLTDEESRRMILGRWETYRDGRRVLDVRDDGAAVMDVQIEGLKSLVVGSKLKLYIAWTIENGVLTFETTGGDPQSSVDLLNSWYGNRREQTILVLDDKTFRVPDDDSGDADHIWTRIAPAP